jgi:hypothetical protein
MKFRYLFAALCFLVIGCSRIVTDLPGTSPNTSEFADGSLPSILSTIPASNALFVGIGTVLKATFSEDIQSNTLSFVLKGPGNSVISSTTTYNATTKVATLVPSGILSNSTDYTATISGAKDSAGNTMAPVTFSFTTIAASNPSAFSPATDLTYLGAFRVPQSGGYPSSFSYGGEAMGFDPQTNSLIMSGHAHGSYVGRIGIPTPVIGTNLSDLNTAQLLEGFCDPLNGQIGTINPTDPNSKKLGGFLPLADSLVISAYSFYDGNVTATASHFLKNSTDICSTTNLQGPYRVSNYNPGFVGGYMTQVPVSLQGRLGGPALTGLSNTAITGRTSQGPSAFPFDPALLGVQNPVPATPLLAYPLVTPYPPGYPNAGYTSPFDPATNPWNAVTTVRGLFVHEASESIVFIGHQLLDEVCYKINCSDPGGFGTVTGRATLGVWVFKFSDIDRSKSGLIQSHEVPPAGWYPLTLPLGGTNATGGVAYDPQTKRVYISQKNVDPGTGYFAGPIIHVYQAR